MSLFGNTMPWIQQYLCKCGHGFTVVTLPLKPLMVVYCPACRGDDFQKSPPPEGCMLIYDEHMPTIFKTGKAEYVGKFPIRPEDMEIIPRGCMGICKERLFR